MYMAHVCFMSIAVTVGIVVVIVCLRSCFVSVYFFRIEIAGFLEGVHWSAS